MTKSVKQVPIILPRYHQRFLAYRHFSLNLLHHIYLQDTVYDHPYLVLFSVFDLLAIKIFKFSDLILMFKSVVRGFAFLTGQPSPDI